MRRASAFVALLVLTLLLAGCTGVPQSSSPEVVRTVGLGGGEQAASTVTPKPGVQPESLVRTFLGLNAVDAGKHASARTFLTPAARSRWTDTTVTVVSSLTVGAYTPGKPIIVNATQLGSVDATGVYTPVTATGKAAVEQFSFGIAKVGTQYRINSLNSGLLLTESQFSASFVPRSVYFFDLAHGYLVPDARWTPDTDPIDTSETLVNLLAGAPSKGLQNAVSNDTLPAQSGTRHIDVTGTNLVKIEIPGASQLASTDKDLLAAQIAATLGDVDRGRSLQITDGGSAVSIPDSGSTEFTASDFRDTMVVPPQPELYYIRRGQIVDEKRQLLGGPLNSGRYPLTSLAVSRSGPGGNLSVAGVTGSAASARLVMGSQGDELRRTSVVGVTSRPAFAPGRVEAWVGAGTRVYRATLLSDSRIVASPVSLPAPVAGQTVVALRLSPEGSRIALVLLDRTGHKQLWTGDVVRTATSVSITSLQQISPDDVMVTDLAWIEGERLNAIGYDRATQEPHVYRTGADGSAWTTYPITGLPAAPASLAGAPGAPAYAAADANVYEQSRGIPWSYLGGGSTPALGSAPAYVE
ncbi:LpqB family beta-propeller domain-containing protein [uncultured Jatrophihabitans sp.]|uniref:LpqB family beta-propeller domain-containing protein n=1 Tax=uncultured Jatrophihabitans sp. TaxID=1610747 RepID=UPI0035CBB723